MRNDSIVHLYLISDRRFFKRKSFIFNFEVFNKNLKKSLFGVEYFFKISKN